MSNRTSPSSDNDSDQFLIDTEIFKNCDNEPLLIGQVHAIFPIDFYTKLIDSPSSITKINLEPILQPKTSNRTLRVLKDNLRFGNDIFTISMEKADLLFASFDVQPIHCRDFDIDLSEWADYINVGVVYRDQPVSYPTGQNVHDFIDFLCKEIKVKVAGFSAILTIVVCDKLHLGDLLPIAMKQCEIENPNLYRAKVTFLFQSREFTMFLSGKENLCLGEIEIKELLLERIPDDEEENFQKRLIENKEEILHLFNNEERGDDFVRLPKWFLNDCVDFVNGNSKVAIHQVPPSLQWPGENKFVSRQLWTLLGNTFGFSQISPTNSSPILPPSPPPLVPPVDMDVVVQEVVALPAPVETRTERHEVEEEDEDERILNLINDDDSSDEDAMMVFSPTLRHLHHFHRDHDFMNMFDHFDNELPMAYYHSPTPSPPIERSFQINRATSSNSTASFNQHVSNPFSYSTTINHPIDNQRGNSRRPFGLPFSSQGLRSLRDRILPLRVNLQTKTPQELPGHLQEFDYAIGQEVHVMEDFNRSSTTIVKATLMWMGKINGQWLFGLESDHPQVKIHEYFNEFVQHIGHAVGKHGWLISPEHVRPTYRPFIRPGDLPFGNLRPEGFQMGAKMKVIESGEIGFAKWTGTINGDWFIGLEIINRNSAFSRIQDKYPVLIDLFPCSNDHPMMLVSSRAVQLHQEIDVQQFVSIRNERDHLKNRVQQLTRLVETNDAVRSTSFASTSDNNNLENPPEHQGPAVPECIICRSESSAYIIIPCGHLCLCANCHYRYSSDNNLKMHCPLCRGRVNSYVKVRM